MESKKMSDDLLKDQFEKTKDQFEKIKEQNRLKKKQKKLQKKLDQHKAMPVLVGDLMELNQSFQKVVDEQGRLSYQSNLNLRALFKLLIDKKLITEEELSGSIKALLEKDKEVFSKIKRKGELDEKAESKNDEERPNF